MFWFLVNASTEEIGAFVSGSVVLIKDWPTIFVGSPLITSATHISLRINSASEGLIK